MVFLSSDYQRLHKGWAAKNLKTITVKVTMPSFHYERDGDAEAFQRDLKESLIEKIVEELRQNHLIEFDEIKSPQYVTKTASICICKNKKAPF
jgi:hypothetical protein